MKLTVAEKWLKLVAILHIIGGLLLPMLVLTPLLETYFIGIEQSFPNSNPESLRFLVGIFGPTVASWALLFFYSVSKAFHSKTFNDWLYLVLALLVWALIDSVYSFYFGIYSHIIINAVVFSSLLIPLLLVRKHFKKHS